MSSKLKIGVIGVGKMGRLHLGKLVNCPEAEVAGIYDKDVTRARDVSQQTGVRAFESLSDLLFESDAVVIATPTATHHPIGRQALESGAHVLMEKPIASTLSEAEDLVRLAEEKKLLLQVGLIERFRYLALSKGYQLSPARFVECHRLSPTLAREGNIDVVSDLMIHDLDLVLSVMEEEPVEVSAIGVEVLTPHIDMANVRLEFPTGAVVNLSASRVSVKSLRKFRVFSQEAYASMDFVSNSANIYFRNTSGHIEHRMVEMAELDPLKDQAFHFVRSIRENGAPIVSGRDGLRALKFAKIIQQKIAERAKRHGGTRLDIASVPDALVGEGRALR